MIRIELVVITTSSVYCDHKKKQQQANRQTKHQLSKPKKKMKKRKEKETKNKPKKFSQGSNLGPLDVESLAEPLGYTGTDTESAI